MLLLSAPVVRELGYTLSSFLVWRGLWEISSTVFQRSATRSLAPDTPDAVAAASCGPLATGPSRTQLILAIVMVGCGVALLTAIVAAVQQQQQQQLPTSPRHAEAPEDGVGWWPRVG